MLIKKIKGMILNAKFVRYVRLSRAKTVWSFLYVEFYAE